MNRSHHIRADGIGRRGSGNTKVHDLDFSLCGDHDILRFDIPMDDLFVVGSFNTSCYLNGNTDGFLKG